MDFLVTAKLVYVAPAVAIVATLLVAWGRLRGRRIVHGVGVALLATSVAAGGWLYVEPNYRIKSWLNTHEFYHYYIATKYAHEVGYTGMYVASIRAMERQGVKPPPETRNLDTSRRIPWPKMVKVADRVEKRFTPERWAAFSHDVKFFYDQAPGRFAGLVKDRGYNATPIWTMVSGAIASAVPTDGGITWLPWLDVGLWLLTAAVVWRTYGAVAALLVFATLFTQMFTSHAHLKFAFLRTDWINCLLLSTCLLRRGHHGSAGVLFGYATLCRVFPAIFGFGMGAKLLWTWIQHRRVDRGASRFLLAAGATVIVLAGLSVLVVGVPVWREFLSKIAIHNNLITDWRIGWKFLFMMPSDPDHRETFFATWSWLFWLLNLVVIAAAFLPARHLDDDETLGFGFLLFFFLVAPAYYYYVALLVPALWYASRLDRPMGVLGIVQLFVLALLGHGLYRAFDLGPKLFLPMSFAVLLHVTWMYAAVAWRGRTRRDGGSSDVVAVPDEAAVRGPTPPHDAAPGHALPDGAA